MGALKWFTKCKIWYTISKTAHGNS